MIDFKNSDFLKLKKISNEEVINQITPLLISGECLISSYKTIRDFVVFTNKRVIAVNVQGITGSKKILHLFHIQKFKLTLLKQQVLLI